MTDDDTTDTDAETTSTDPEPTVREYTDRELLDEFFARFTDRDTGPAPEDGSVSLLIESNEVLPKFQTQSISIDVGGDD